MVKERGHFSAPLASILCLIACACISGPSHALYKVVGPDGKITYTDRPSTTTESKVQNMGKAGAANVGIDESLPYELRQTASRFPVTLYSTDKCAPCDAGRQLLRQRGIPFLEKTISTVQDSAALQQIAGGNNLPVLAIGSQVILGMMAAEWQSYLDSAGYPKESQLPPKFSTGTVSPLTPPVSSVPVTKPGTPSPATVKQEAPPQPVTTPGKPAFQF
jgi:glutaredoxin